MVKLHSFSTFPARVGELYFAVEVALSVSVDQ